MSNLEKFLNNYGNYLTESTSINMDLENVINDVSNNILDPKTDNPTINKLYQRGLNLNKDRGTDLIPKLKSLK
jgi:hypothetical protein